MRSSRLTAGILGLVAILSLAGSTAAQDEEIEASDFVRDGWYVGAQWNLGMENWNIPTTAVGDSQGLSAYVGWRFLKYGAMDFQYEWQSGFATTEGSVEGEANAHVFSVNARAYLPYGRYQPFLLGGLGLFQTSRSAGAAVSAKGDFTVRTGGGVDVYITKNWVLEGSAIYIVPTGGLNDQRYVSFGVGLQYRFDPYIY